MIKQVFWCFCLLMVWGVSAARADLQVYDSKYYKIYTDVDPDYEKEAAVRMTRMAEEYHNRTRGFSGEIREKLPFYLFKSAADYYAAGAPKGTGGVFMSKGPSGKLMAIAGQNSSVQTWHIVQHEGFHQFVHMAIGGQMPIWINEGLAEYFGEGIFTGDGFVTGIVPPFRLVRLKQELEGGDLKSFEQIARVTSEDWLAQMNIKNYDQAWSMVHFLVNADGDKYQNDFSQCIREISRGKDENVAMRATIGRNAGLEDRWKAWWLEQPESPTTLLYHRAAVATMTSFVARAFVQRQTFADFHAFQDAVGNQTLRMSADDWLPTSLIDDAIRLYGSEPDWLLRTGTDKQPRVSLKLSDGSILVGSFTLRGARVDQVQVDVDDMAAVLKDAQALLDQKKKEQAKTMLVNAIRTNPNSAMIADAKKLLQSCR